MKVLNLYAGIGGNRKLWEDVEVTAVEIDPDIAKIYQDYFPDDKVIVDDAHQYLLDHFKEFDFIWSSPPCPTHSRARFARKETTVSVYPDMKLYQEILFLKYNYNGSYAVENVKPYYTPLIPGKELGRHLIWANFAIGSFQINGRDITNQQGMKDFEYNGNQRKDKILRNGTEPEVGLYILNCARNIITKQNEKQIDLFE